MRFALPSVSGEISRSIAPQNGGPRRCHIVFEQGPTHRTEHHLVGDPASVIASSAAGSWRRHQVAKRVVADACLVWLLKHRCPALARSRIRCTLPPFPVVSSSTHRTQKLPGFALAVAQPIRCMLPCPPLPSFPRHARTHRLICASFPTSNRSRVVGAPTSFSQANQCPAGQSLRVTFIERNR